MGTYLLLEFALPTPTWPLQALKRAGSREPTRSVRQVLKIQRFLFIALAVWFAASFTAAFASPVAFWASPFNS